MAKLSTSLVARVFGRIYAAVVDETVPPGFQSHVFVLRATGAWPSTDHSSLYKYVTIAFFTIVGIAYPLWQFVNILYIDFTISDALQLSFASLPAIAATFKVAVIYWQRDTIRAYYRIHSEIVSDGGRRWAAANDRVARVNIRIHATFTSLYVLWAILTIVQSLLAQPEDKIIVFTSNLPFDFAKHRAVYAFVVIFQIASSLCVVTLVALVDSFFMALMNTVCGHLKQLRERLCVLGTMGTGEDDRNLRFYRDMIDCCQRYEECLM